MSVIDQAVLMVTAVMFFLATAWLVASMTDERRRAAGGRTTPSNQSECSGRRGYELACAVQLGVYEVETT